MKKIIAATLFASAFVSAVANASGSATTTDVQLAAGTYKGIGSVTTDINLARKINILAIASRAGFVKNDFEATLSANVVAGVIDSAATNSMGVAAGSNKGYTVFTGSSVGGSVAQCGDPLPKTTANLAAAAIKAGVINLAAANGCGTVSGA
ncbi:hypothetical protein KRX52_17030 [Pseudomonas sp. MAP12]|uniref:Uncharacterized protein n=1 Tax=Geopseudomonas aromaticivorans TaxID=2849492 RepID=A0ABS6N098_9GAMM|nr:hypothetical protein [Pseudomonas aromaticivorans]MBV2134487.1 hypothetical protein [Pseudomonas aromaticivorans]